MAEWLRIDGAETGPASTDVYHPFRSGRCQVSTLHTSGKSDAKLSDEMRQPCADVDAISLQQELYAGNQLQPGSDLRNGRGTTARKGGEELQERLHRITSAKRMPVASACSYPISSGALDLRS